ncbi:hypothetical protein AGDE_00848 [Angomonas deanei]|uniref:CHAP domain containing protein n=1 Tax=Angomonas deanei TaxID=59799 RepID=S9UNH8_9TRYP|nr:hypothetical protein AGDE_09421 [Angomonas deanei]EPY43075.1 hypothetical protein AGDE_00848 [Angomonas deanei]CAD2217372.1 hypothetical protein, conserved [Angomonas deanei]|eukprot:EPY30483.1 hypothetical protein AGDE_09421 [Angomonas deanei]
MRISQVFPFLAGFLLIVCVSSVVYFARDDYERHLLNQHKKYDTFDPLTNCTTPFDTLLGIADHVPAYSNCHTRFNMERVSYCNLWNPLDVGRTADPADGVPRVLVGEHFTANDYVNRWLIFNRGVLISLFPYYSRYVSEASFAYPTPTPSHRMTVRLHNKQRALDIEDRKLNAPRRGDVVVFDAMYTEGQPHYLPSGHIAVVVKVENNLEHPDMQDKEKKNKLIRERLQPRRVYIAEQNLYNRHWEGKNYSRVMDFYWEPTANEKEFRAILQDNDGLTVLGRIRAGRRVPTSENKPSYQLGLQEAAKEVKEKYGEEVEVVTPTDQE